jgi:hypothetical protein
MFAPGVAFTIVCHISGHRRLREVYALLPSNEERADVLYFSRISK